MCSSDLLRRKKLDRPIVLDDLNAVVLPIDDFRQTANDTTFETGERRSGGNFALTFITGSNELFDICTTVGPYALYGSLLVQLCAEEGTHYADTTGESDFFRRCIDLHDATARATGATIVSHCGNDCVPWDLAVLAAAELARDRFGPRTTLSAASTFTELPPGVGASGGTLATAIYQLGKKRGGSRTAFDPLLRLPDGSKSKEATKVRSPKSDVYYEEFGAYGGPWIMQPVMGNCVRRSNALLGYNAGEEFAYSEAQLRQQVQRLQVYRLRSRLADVTQKMNQREQLRKRIISQRINQMTQEAERAAMEQLDAIRDALPEEP